jgi:hypothetical protein
MKDGSFNTLQLYIISRRRTNDSKTMHFETHLTNPTKIDIETVVALQYANEICIDGLDLESTWECVLPVPVWRL